jgi:hypothetical protein
MNTNTPRCEISARDRLFLKLHPSRFPSMSDVMAAVVGFLLGEPFVNPAIAEIVVTSDGFLLARTEGESCANVFIGKYPDLVRNWLRLLTAACLSPDEQLEAASLFAAKIGFFGPTSA